MFKSMFDGTLRGKSDALLVFINLLANSDREGFVDRHFNAISDETGLPVDRVKTALEELESPDPESRSKDLEGRRLERISDDRGWGWRIVNYLHYRKLRDEEERRTQNRAAQQRFRDKNKPASAKRNRNNQSKPMQRQKQHSSKDETHLFKKGVINLNRSLFSEDELRIIDAYHAICCSQDIGFLPITCRSPELEKVLDVWKDTDQETIENMLKDAVVEGKEKTLVRCLWSNY